MKNLISFDKIALNDLGCKAEKIIPQQAIFFEGHYPGNPIFPGVLQIELALNAARLLLPEAGHGSFNLHRINKFRFLKRVLPGDKLSIIAKIKEEFAGELLINVDLLIDDQKVAAGLLSWGVGWQDASETGSGGIYLQSNHSLDYGTEIISTLPHRFPFLHVDEVLEIEENKRLVSAKNITASDYVFWGRTYGSAFPQTIMIEALAQSAAILGMQGIKPGGVPLFGGLSEVCFTGEAYPGDKLIMEAVIVKSMSSGGIVAGKIVVNNRQICCIENLIYMVAENDKT